MRELEIKPRDVGCPCEFRVACRACAEEYIDALSRAALTPAPKPELEQVDPSARKERP